MRRHSTAEGGGGNCQKTENLPSDFYQRAAQEPSQVALRRRSTEFPHPYPCQSLKEILPQRLVATLDNLTYRAKKKNITEILKQISQIGSQNVEGSQQEDIKAAKAGL
jgi:hypothetical protein